MKFYETCPYRKADHCYYNETKIQWCEPHIDEDRPSRCPISKVDYLCDRCKDRNSCPVAYDAYNQVIDNNWYDYCLGEK